MPSMQRNVCARRSRRKPVNPDIAVMRAPPSSDVPQAIRLERKRPFRRQGRYAEGPRK
jgi:hypothetical protein